MPKKSKQLKKKKKQYLNFLKQLTKWITTTPRNKKIIEKLINDYDITSSNLLLRVSSYCYNKPRIIWYINKYFNELFNINQMDSIELIYNLALLLDVNNHNKANKFYYLKANELKDNNKKIICDLIKQYSEKVYLKILNVQELNFYYYLFQSGIIKNQDILDLDIALNSEQTIKLENIAIQNNTTTDKKFSKKYFEKYFENIKTQQLPITIQNFNDELLNKSDLSQCLHCKLNGFQKVGIDTNLTEPGIVDFAFIGLNSGKDERIFMKPAINNAGKLQREKMFQMHPDTKWVILNSILCSVNNQKELGTNKEINKIINNCNNTMMHILQHFPAKYYVLVGKQIMNQFGFKKSITNTCGEIIIGSNGAKYIPIINPNAVIQYHGNMEAIFNHGFNQIIKLSYELYNNSSNNNITHTQQIINNDIHQKQYNNISNNKYNIPSEKIITKVTDDLTFLDSIDINGIEAVLTFIDDKGIKKYLFTNCEMPIYIKNTNWKNCNMIESDYTHIVKINGRNKYQLIKDIKENLTLKQKTVV